MTEQFDMVVVGSGFAASFFLHGYLQHASANTKILVLEQGAIYSHAWRAQNQRLAATPFHTTFINQTPHKKWMYTPAFGGSSAAWWACTPRFLPNDFKLQSSYGVGIDWPSNYNELEPFYAQAESLFNIAGENRAPYPRSQPLPQSAHRFSQPDQILKQAYPDLYFPQPTARTPKATQNRSACCNSSVCGSCPVDAKFTVQNEMQSIYKDPRVTLRTEAQAIHIETANDIATGVIYRHQNIEKTVKADSVILAANALFNPFLLLRSGIQHPLLGKRLHEQVSVTVKAYLDGVDNYQGSTSINANGYMLYDGEHRKDYAACLLEHSNVPHLRTDFGKWRQLAIFKCIFEDLPSEQNTVSFDQTTPDEPIINHQSISDYAQRGIQHLEQNLNKALSPLPIEKLEFGEPSQTEGHILGTTMMGNDVKTAVVDRYLKLHQLSNLWVLGGSVFPTSSPSNPTLTLSALSLWAAAHY
ncbi:GMC family oxidoreductase [Candidatus Albibeggiatoa sp. nov. NOAA]|uniref:GMC family oxidoreductase n=1 Tax=Candidatus Albibeggiatoa sp. nov. NOAA TaxID=3162724 RepID=UPI0032FF4039|nr:GMC family oxidoreductase [Thiotrichaceae bacterium]